IKRKPITTKVSIYEHALNTTVNHAIRLYKMVVRHDGNLAITTAAATYMLYYHSQESAKRVFLRPFDFILFGPGHMLFLRQEYAGAGWLPAHGPSIRPAEHNPVVNRELANAHLARNIG